LVKESTSLGETDNLEKLNLAIRLLSICYPDLNQARQAPLAMFSGIPGRPFRGKQRMLAPTARRDPPYPVSQHGWHGSEDTQRIHLGYAQRDQVLPLRRRRLFDLSPAFVAENKEAHGSLLMASPRSEKN
jgi:hypothetical protein